MAEQRIYRVGELTGDIKNILEGRFSFVRVAGEIANLSRPGSGHLYFTLKDERAQLKVALFKMQRRYLAREPENGMEVVCVGRISVYEPRGEYQLIADTLEFRGAGDLRRAFEELKRRLAAEGLFDPAVKRPVPAMPRRITLVTSPQGAAVHDFIRIATRRFPGVHISVYPVPVQGAEAAPAMAAALARLRRGDFATDVLVLCRGGGSEEDLWAYNDEALVRAIRADGPPVVSAVGHEIDFTLADFAADLRAATPSAAAELLTPDQRALREKLEHCRARLSALTAHRLDMAAQRLDMARLQLRGAAHPVDRLRLELAGLLGRLERAMLGRLEGGRERLRALGQVLLGQDPRLTLYRREQRLALVRTRLSAVGRRALADREERCRRAVAVLQAVSPLATLSRGYAIARKVDKTDGAEGQGAIVRDAAQARPGEALEILLGRGRLDCRVEATHSGDENMYSHSGMNFARNGCWRGCLPPKAP